jgi:hypothetical protein
VKGAEQELIAAYRTRDHQANISMSRSEVRHSKANVKAIATGGLFVIYKVKAHTTCTLILLLVSFIYRIEKIPLGTFLTSSRHNNSVTKSIITDKTLYCHSLPTGTHKTRNTPPYMAANNYYDMPRKRHASARKASQFIVRGGNYSSKETNSFRAVLCRAQMTIRDIIILFVCIQ